jgi:RNA-directed DNA polymerase
MLMEEVLRRENVHRAYKRVVRNAGAPGVDGMTVDELMPWCREHWARVREELLCGRYHPQPVLRVEIPKPGGSGVRLLGIPTVVDRLIQQALLQALHPIFDPGFSDSSFGFRPGRSTHQAVLRARQHMRAGFRWVVDMDLEKFFDRVNHDTLMSRVARKVRDKRVLLLIRRFLQAGVLVDGAVSPRSEGTPQGGPLSPLLSNVLLDELDKELEQRGHRFVRYADDCNIYVQSKAAGERVLASLERFLSKRLRLKVNRDKSAVDRPWNRTFLGYTVTNLRKAQLRISPKAVSRVKEKIRRITASSRGRSMRSVLKELAPVLRGWVAYFRLARNDKLLGKLDQWLRRRLRVIQWRHWKTPRTRLRRLKAAGVHDVVAAMAAYSGRGPWACSAMGAINTAMSNRTLESMGLVSLQQEHRRLARTR